MDLWQSLLGLTLGILGAAIIAAYTWINASTRRKGARSHWGVGALTAAFGMTSLFAGWVLLSLARPCFRTLWLQVPGGAACVLALAIYASSARRVGRLRGPARYSLELETGGIHGRVRHPQALALCVLAVGLALLSGSVPYLATLPIWLGFWVGYTYLEERNELIPAFGEEYMRYRDRTPRILPRLPRGRKQGPLRHG